LLVVGNSQVLSHGCESVVEAKKVSVEVVRQPVGETVLQKFWNKSKRFGFVPKFLDKMEKFCFCFKKFWNKSKHFGFVPNFLD
jgi:hypothetical protein